MGSTSKVSKEGLKAGGLTDADIARLEKREKEMKMLTKFKIGDKKNA